MLRWSLRFLRLDDAIGKRDMETTSIFMSDLRRRIINQPVINSDAFNAYPEAVERYFGHGVHYGQIVKSYAGEPAIDTARRYSPGHVVAVLTRVVSGRPGKISTSYIEHQNLSLRMAQRRFTRLTNASGRLRNWWTQPRLRPRSRTARALPASR